MRIQVKRTGGIAGITRDAEVDTSDHGDAADWHTLVDQAVSAARETPPIGVPDGFNYQITVDGRTVYCADPRLTDAQRHLISRVLEEGRRSGA
ncbi:protealysin inhibitor emfourin [Streptomyces sp. NPDC058045]|uniref:protealysin inhibitor emfourin n=1 Tax=Streptomyces sp. NPDC058045 TaxID=3346311 RepID=UPI0036E1A9E5